jgi:VCBS repeat-containing protein
MNSAMHIGRVGALAVALGVGMAAATTPGLAWATPDTNNNTDATSAPDSTKTPAANTATDTGSLSTPASTASVTTETPSTTPAAGTATASQSTTETTQTNSVAPSVVIRSSGGALTSGADSPTLAAGLATTPAFIPTPALTPKSRPSTAAESPVGQSFSAPQLTAITPRTTALVAPTVDLPTAEAATLRVSAFTTDDQGSQFLTTRTAFTALAPKPAPAPAAADPITALLAVPVTFITTATNLVTAVLASFIAPTPGTPADSPLLWTVLAFVRRQFFNETPTITPTVSKPDALGNITISLSETDADGDRLVYSASDGVKGAVSLNADGHSFTYTPDAGQTGTDTVAVTATDETNAHIHGLPGLINALSFGLFGDSGHTAATTVTVKLNTPPTLSASPGAPNQTDGKVTVTVVTIDDDGDPPTLSVTQPAAATGTVSTPTLVDAATGTYSVVYTPNDEARHTASAETATARDKSDSFTVSVSDGHGASLTRTVDVTVAPANNAPAFRTVTTTTDAFTGKVTGTVVFTDGDNDTLTYTGSGQTAKGNVVVDAAGTFTYTPTSDARFVATATEGDDTDKFTITVNDGHGATPTLTITATVTPAAIASDGAGALAAAQSVIDSALGARATAQADMATLVTSLGSTLTGAQLDALMSQIMADIAATQSTDTQTAADGKAAIRTKLGQAVTDTDIAAIAAKTAAIRAAETSLTRPITVAADARAIAVATIAATGAPVFSRVKDLVVSPTGAVTGTLVFIDPEGDPLLYNVLGVAGNPAPGTVAMNPLTGAFLYAPNPLFGGSATSVTLLVFVNDGVHLVAQDVTIGVTPTADPTTLAEAEAALADIQAALDAAIKDQKDALTTDITGITAQTAQIQAKIAALLDSQSQVLAATTRA